MDSLDNIQIALLNKVNQLAERHGIAPYQFVAVVKYDKDANTILSYENPAAETPEMEDRFFRMLGDLGLDHNKPDLTGSDKDIFEALDRALARAPKPRSR